MKKMICDVWYFGLGDNLAFSTLPERCHENGMEFYLYDQVKQHFQQNNNPEIFDLVWRSNPYFKGFSTEKFNAGNMYKSKNINKSIIWQFEQLHGFKPKNHYPKIYCELKKLEELKNATVIDLNSYHFYKQYWSQKDGLKKKVLSLIDTEKVYYVQTRKYISKINDINKELLSEFNPLCVYSLFHYADIINSCKQFITVNSGGNSLASAIKQDNKKPIVYTILPNDEYSSYCFNNINYYQL